MTDEPQYQLHGGLLSDDSDLRFRQLCLIEAYRRWYMNPNRPRCGTCRCSELGIECRTRVVNRRFWREQQEMNATDSVRALRTEGQ